MPEEKLTEEQIKDIMSEPNTDITNKSVVTEPDEPVDEPVIEEPKVEAPKPEPEAKKEEPAVKQDDIDMIAKLDKELAKPEGQENLKDFSDREKAYFWSMRRDRRARQKAEEERDALRFRELKREAEAKAKEAVEAPKEEDPFKGKEDDDFLTVAEAKKLAQTIKPKKDDVKPAVDVNNPVVQGYLRMCDDAASKQFDDYNEVMETVNDILPKNPAYQQKVLDAMVKGDNPAIAMYQLLKGDPEFPKHLPVAKARLAQRQPEKSEPPAPPAPTAEDLKKLEEAKRKEEALKNPPPKTSGHVSASDGGNKDSYSLDELMHMSEKEFSRLPKKFRENILRQYG